MTFVFAYKKILLKSVILSALIHSVLIFGFTFTMTITPPEQMTFFSFLGSILSEREVSHDVSASQPGPSLAEPLGIDFGASKMQSDIGQRKPELLMPVKISQKTFIKSTFLDPQNSASNGPAEERFQLKEPLHVPLTLDSHDQN